MKLSEYLNFKNNHNNIIDLLKYEELIKNLSNNNHIQNGNLTFNNNILNELDNNIKIFLSSNPDQDFPNPKKEIFDGLINNNINYINKLNLTNNNKNIKIFCHSVGKLEDNINMVPIGRDWKNKNFFNKVDSFTKKDKNILCYYNCTLPPDIYHWYSNPRILVLNILKNKNFVKIENCEIQPRKINNNDSLNYLKKISQSKFMVCPRGCGIDTYRMWDCIYLGCIPIIIKYEGYKQFEDLPILFLEDWKELKDIDEEFLNKKWTEMLEKDYNYDKLNLEYWKNKILNS
jgi:hypothetical protein